MQSSPDKTGFHYVLKGSHVWKGHTAAMPSQQSEQGSLPCSSLAGMPEPSKKSLRVPPAGRKASPSLVSLKHNCNKKQECFCGKWSLRGQVEGSGMKYVRLGCKKWVCPRCGPKKAVRVRHGIADQATKHNLNRFLTLTLNPVACTAEESVAYSRRVWRKFRVYVKRRYKIDLKFIAVVEFQKSGYAHLHVLVSHYLDQRWVSNAWSKLGGGPMVNIKYVDVHRISSYVSKYLAKDLFLAHGSGKYRRYTTSKGLNLFVKAAKGTWELLKTRIEILERKLGSLVTEPTYDQEGILTSFIEISEVKP